ncbi:uncharacterized protein SAPINGB_P004323 [Magnusiomyces paraingens]|uniref:Thioesterase domain-containing protein n=1 Tax=Magnusiomyces paraingens TaxID=2606893 RepID=A0A5E8BW93_9ASCO|nr:uncharacterized protein SAPINGB_P004323 [Saprochaete ingens]VVT54909.1 unnamed protein product [Saprochaete ingens]
MEKLASLRPGSNRADRVNLFINGTPLISNSSEPMSAWGAKTSEAAQCISCEDLSGDPQSKYLLRAEFEMTVTREMLNPRGTMHGGFQVTLFDNLSSFAVAGFDRYWEGYSDEEKTIDIFVPIKRVAKMMGVSRTLTATFLRAVSEGDLVKMEVFVVAETKTFTVITGRVYDKQGRVATEFFHDKVKVAARI